VLRTLRIHGGATSRRTRWQLCAAAVAAVGLAACSSNSTSSSNASTSGAAAPKSASIVAAYTGAIDTLDPQQSDYGQTSLVDSALYEPLVNYTSTNHLVGDLATSFVLSPSATSVRITLRSGVTFHAGTPLTSADVKFSLDRYEQLGTGIGGLLSDYKSTTVINNTHLVINLKTPNSLFLGELSKAYILDATTVTAHAGSDEGQAWLANHDAGTGPYELAPAASSGGNIVLDRYSHYWAFTAQRPTSLVMRRIDESATQRKDLEAGDINYANNLSEADAVSSKSSHVAMTNLGVIQQQYIYFNVTTGPTSNVKVRRALQMAFDYSGALKSILGGAGETARGPLPLGMACEPTFPQFTQNLPEAKSLLAQAGYTHLSLTMRYQPEIAEQAQEAVLFQSDLRSIGVTLKLVPITFSAYLTTLSSSATIPQMMLLADNTQIPNAGSFLTQFYGPSSSGQNRSGFKSTQLDALLDAAASTNNAAAQCSDYEKAQHIVYNAATAVDLFSVPWPLAYTTNVGGVVVSPITTPISLATLRVK
jgi:peptide/nickel transport system substrate-binding protein